MNLYPGCIIWPIYHCAPLYGMVATPTNPPLKYQLVGDAVVADRGGGVVNNTTSNTATTTTISTSLCYHELQVGDLPRLQVQQGLDAVWNELVATFPNETAAIDAFLQLMECAKWQVGQFAMFKIFPPPLQWILSQLLCSTLYAYYASLTMQ